MLLVVRIPKSIRAFSIISQIKVDLGMNPTDKE